MVVVMLAYLWLHPTPHWKAFAPICKAADVNVLLGLQEISQLLY
jgi:hypothetical protein